MKRSFILITVLVALMCVCSYSFAQTDETVIELADAATTVTGDGATVEGDVITISKAGDYKVSGTLSNGQIVVEVSKEHKVTLKLNGVNITCAFSAPIAILSADKVEIKLIEGTENTLTDTMRGDPEDSKLPNACLYSADDITIKGTGILNVFGYNNNGIGTKNDLRINGGIINVAALNNALKGKDSVAISGGRITITGSDDGIKADEEEDEEEGFVSITGATVYITASDDAIQAYRSVTIRDASVYTYAADMSINCDGTISIAPGCLIEN